MNAIFANLQGSEEKVSPQPGGGGGGADIKCNSPFADDTDQCLHN